VTTTTTRARWGWLVPLAVLVFAIVHPLAGVAAGIAGLAKGRLSRQAMITTVLLIGFALYVWSTAHWIVVDSGGSGTGFDTVP
jgi:p-aminobenzoyl-glutamate transporter AbgT